MVLTTMTRTIALVWACLTACNVAAAPRDGGEIRCPRTPLFAPDRFTVLNIAPFSPGSEDQLAKEMVEYRDRTGGDVVLYSLTLHPEGFPAMRKAEYLVESYRKLRRALEGSGIRLGVLVQSILGHWPRVDKDEESWTRSITLEGKQKRFCPIDPGCRAYIHDVARMLAQEKPCFILLDDDVHASGTFGVECFCERHVEMFNKAGTREKRREQPIRRIRSSLTRERSRVVPTWRRSGTVMSSFLPAIRGCCYHVGPGGGCRRRPRRGRTRKG